MRGRSFWLFPCLLLTVPTEAAAAGEGVCASAVSITCAKHVVVERLVAEVRQLARSDFKPAHGDRVAVIDKEGGEEFRLDLEVGVDYAFVAACGNDCSEVGLVILTESQEKLASSTDAAPAVILSGTVSTTGTYIVTVTAPGCKHVFCGVGLSVVRK